MKRTSQLLALALAFGMTTAAAEEKRTETDFTGSPPFKRDRVALTEAPELEIELPKIELGEIQHEVVMRGKPPFKRDRVVIDEAMLAEALSVESFARFEEVAADADEEEAPRRAGPPGKTHFKP